MNAEEALKLLGPYSKWQLQTYFIYAFGFGVPLAWMFMSIVFIGDTPGHRCALADNATLNESIPQSCDSQGRCRYDKCLMYSDPEIRNETQECDNGYWYDPEAGYDSTLVTDFDLVCSRHMLVEVSMMLNNVGQAIGAFLFSMLSDKFGRKLIFLGCLWGNVAVALTQAFSVNMAMYTSLAFFDGLLQAGMTTSAAVLAMELFPAEQRTFAGIAIEFFWALGYITMVPIAYFFRNWRHLQLAITLPLLATVAFFWWIDESIPWMFANGRHKDAEKVLRKAAKVSGVKLPPKLFHSVKQTSVELSVNYDTTHDSLEAKEQTQHEQTYEFATPLSGGKKLIGRLQATTANHDVTSHSPAEIPQYEVYDMCNNVTMCGYTFIQCCMWFVDSLGYGAMAMTVTYLPGNRYVNSLLYAVTEIPAYALMWVLLNKIGRRISISMCHILGGLALAATVICNMYFQGEYDYILITLSVIGKSAFSMSWAGVFLYTAELYPTNLRSGGLGICSISARVAAIISPYLRVLARTVPWAMPVLVGVLSLIVGVMVLALPETRNEALPHSIEEVKKFKRKL